MSIKLVAIDIDGTLLNPQREITPGVEAALKKARAAGVYIVLASGRPLVGVQNQLETLGLLTEEDYAITYNGALVVNNHTGAVVSEYGLTRDQFLEIDTLARKLNVHLHTEDKEAIYTSNRDISPYTVHESFLVDMQIRFRMPDEIANQVVPTKMMMIDEPEILTEAIQKIPADFYDRYTLVQSTPFFLEVLNKEVSKGLALEKLTEHLGLQQSEVMAIGDQENDLAMIQYAGTGIAMGNGTASAKDLADFVVASNAEDGVKEAIDRFVFLEKK